VAAFGKEDRAAGATGDQARGSRWAVPDCHWIHSTRPPLRVVRPRLCGPCKESWETADYHDLYERCFDVRRVDDLAQLAGDTIRIRDVMEDR